MFFTNLYFTAMETISLKFVEERREVVVGEGYCYPGNK